MMQISATVARVPRAIYILFALALGSLAHSGTAASYSVVAELQVDNLEVSGVAAGKDHAYALDGRGWLYVYDIRDLATNVAFRTKTASRPRLRLETNYADDQVAFGGPIRVGDHLYAWDSWHSGIVIVDIHDATNPVVVQTIPTGTNVYNLLPYGENLIAAQDGAVEVFSLATPSNPVSIGRLAIGMEAWSMAVHGTNLYLAAGFVSPTMFVIDFANPTSLSVLNSFPLSSLPYHMFIIGTNLVSSSDVGLILWRLSSPQQPSVIASRTSVFSRVCARDADALILNGAVLKVSSGALTETQTFDNHSGITPSGFPYGSASVELGTHGLALLSQYQRVLVLRRTNDLRMRISRNRLVDFSTQYGENYQVEWSSEVTTHWQNLGGPIAGSGGVRSVTDPVRDSPQRFYRVFRKSE